MNQAANNLVGEVLSDRYRIERFIAAGGFGSVFAGHDTKLDRPVALKLVFPQYAHQVRREAILGQVEHPNVVKYYDYDQDGQHCFLVMEYLDGPNLSDTTLTVRQIDGFIEQIGSALQKAHEGHLIHRDLKPQNIILHRAGTDQERFVILDFGISSQLDASSTLRAATMDGAGTPEYMAPEQIRGWPPAPTFDVYSFGVILFQLITGRVPFPAGNKTLVSFIEFLENTPVPRFADIETSLPVRPGLEPLVRRCLSINPQERPQSMRELLHKFADIHSGEADDRPAVHENFAPPPSESTSGRVESATLSPDTIANESPDVHDDVYGRKPVADQPEHPTHSSESESDSSVLDGVSLQNHVPSSQRAVDAATIPPSAGELSSKESSSEFRATKAPSNAAFPSWGIRKSDTHEPAVLAEDVAADRPSPFQQKAPQLAESHNNHVDHPSERSSVPVFGPLVTVLLAVVIVVGGVYPAFQRQRIQDRVQKLISSTEHREAQRAVDGASLLAALFVDRGRLHDKIYQAGYGAIEDALDNNDLDSFRGQYEELIEAYPQRAERSSRLLSQLAERMREDFLAFAQSGSYDKSVGIIEGNVFAWIASVKPELVDIDSWNKQLKEVAIQRLAAQRGEGSYDLLQIESERLLQLFPEESLFRQLLTDSYLDQVETFRKQDKFADAVAAVDKAGRTTLAPGDRDRIHLVGAQVYDQWARSLTDDNEKELKWNKALALLSHSNPSHQVLLCQVYEERGRHFLQAAQEDLADADIKQAVEKYQHGICDLNAAKRCCTAVSQHQQVQELLANLADELNRKGREYYDYWDSTAATGPAEQTESAEGPQDQDYRHAITFFSLGLDTGVEQQAIELLYARGFARFELSHPDYRGAIADLSMFVEKVKSAIKATDELAKPELYVYDLAHVESHLAMILAANPEQELRDGKLALQYAQSAFLRLNELPRKPPNANGDRYEREMGLAMLTKGMAYAELGEFKNAYREVVGAGSWISGNSEYAGLAKRLMEIFGPADPKTPQPFRLQRSPGLSTELPEINCNPPMSLP